MTILTSLADVQGLKESWTVECKLARGKDGEGALPEDIWETYSAFANTEGGDIFLGLRELGPGKYEVAGIGNPSKVIREFLDGAGDRSKVSANLLCMDSIGLVDIDGKTIIHIHIPKAPPYLRPVYIGGNALTGSFVRSQSADIRLSPQRVQRMKARVSGELLAKA